LPRFHPLRLVEAGQEVEITRGGKPVAKLVPSEAPRKRTLGTDEGAFVVPDDFDDPLPDDLLEAFYS
jgi:antitoxin (DNA-binding transcriptional repressor) of toxin-antitoxin stability system